MFTPLNRLLPPSFKKKISLAPPPLLPTPSFLPPSTFTTPGKKKGPPISRLAAKGRAAKKSFKNYLFYAQADSLSFSLPRSHTHTLAGRCCRFDLPLTTVHVTGCSAQKEFCQAERGASLVQWLASSRDGKSSSISTNLRPCRKKHDFFIFYPFPPCQSQAKPKPWSTSCSAARWIPQEELTTTPTC